MNLVTLALTCFVAPPASLELENNEVEIDRQLLLFPVRVARPDLHKDLLRIRLYTSVDRGVSWKLVAECGRDGDDVRFTAPRDGRYWFAWQIVRTSGVEPPRIHDLKVGMKVLVNANGAFVRNREKSWKEPDAEVKGLRRTVERLQHRIKELEAEKRDAK